MGKNQFSTSIRAFNIGGETKSPFISNRVRTSRYTKLSFLPKAIILQFSRLANIYFLISAIIMEIPGISSLSPMSAIAPFVFVIAVSVIREGFEDLPRQKSDKKVNSSMAQRLERTGEVRNISWADIRVGNIMVLKEEAEIPADLVLLATSNRDGMAYIETGSLDGEKNLKPKFTMPDVVKYFNNDKVENQDLYNCRIQAQVPDPNIHYFEGVFFGDDGKKIPLQAKQILLRGAKLKNTDWALGAVVYSGYDTKIMKNAEGKKNKSSNIERLVNKLILAILILQFIVCALMGLFNYFWSASNADKALYLGEDDYVVGDSFIEILSYYILTNTMIPISLIISIEIVKVAQALFIEKDRDMFNPINGESTKVFSSSMNEELGLVGYIFSDKTGTLTSNNMIFKTFVIGDEVYGETRPKLYSSARKTDFDFYAAKDGYQAPSNQTNYPPSSAPLFKRQIQAALAGTALETVDFVEGTGKHFGLNFQTQKDLVIEFMQAVATCHECLAEPGKDPNVIQYQGQSQDEIRLLETAKDGGFAYLGGGIGKKRVRLLNEEKEFEVLQVFEFNSDRKRMSILVRDGRVLKLYTKGADNIVCARLSKKAQQPFQEGIIEKLEEYSKVGYRTLVYAMRIVNEDEYQKITRNIESVADAENRDEAVEKYVDEFEKELFLLGCSAVEDKLQKNVPDVIHELLSAGIKVWMATGDKLHTAENVAYSCRLIKGDTSIMRCVGESLEEVRTKMAENKEIFDVCVSENRKRALIIQGDALAFVLSDDQLREQFVTIVLDCDAVVCCRVTPKQKADVIRLVKSRTSKVTLAVGDGANDVNMIQAADIGIGLYGQEGMQAVQASDYAIAEFQSLWRLLLVHGRWSYVRISEMILYFFYKNMLFTLPQAFFGIQCSFTGQTIYEDYYVTFYNLMFTALPLVIKAILDQDINYKRIRPSKKSKIQDQGAIIDEDQEIKDQFAELYNYNRNNPLFTITSFLKWVAEGVVVSAILYFCAMGMIGDLVINDQGQTGGMWYFSISLYSAVILIVDIRLALSTRSWTVLYTVILFASVAFYFAYTVFYDDLQFSVSSDTVGLNYGSIQFYTFMLLMAGLSFIVDLTRRTWRNTNRMSLADRLRLHQKLKAKKLAGKDSFDYSMEGKSKSLSLQENKRSETHASLVMNGKYEPPRLY